MNNSKLLTTLAAGLLLCGNLAAQGDGVRPLVAAFRIAGCPGRAGTAGGPPGHRHQPDAPPPHGGPLPDARPDAGSPHQGSPGPVRRRSRLPHPVEEGSGARNRLRRPAGGQIRHRAPLGSLRTAGRKAGDPDHGIRRARRLLRHPDAPPADREPRGRRGEAALRHGHGLPRPAAARRRGGFLRNPLVA